LYPFPAAFYNTYGPFMPLSSPNASPTSSSTSVTVRTKASAGQRRYSHPSATCPPTSASYISHASAVNRRAPSYFIATCEIRNSVVEATSFDSSSGSHMSIDFTSQSPIVLGHRSNVPSVAAVVARSVNSLRGPDESTRCVDQTNHRIRMTSQ